MTDYPFVKGHGTENDFVLLPDHDGSVHGELPPERVRALCDRRAGLGGDGVIRVIRTTALAALGDLPVPVPEAEWFMDYRNADGSVSEMCGNGVRVFVRHLLDEGLVDGASTVRVGTRDGVKTVVCEPDGRFTVDMGVPRLLGETKVALGGRSWPALHVELGNPHAVAFVEDLYELSAPGTLLTAPDVDDALYPEGVNVELVVRRGERHVAFRVHERGSGETRSCGTGACAVLVAVAAADDAGQAPHEPVAYRVDVPGGTLTATLTPEGRVLLAGPAALVARGTTDL